MDGEIIAIIRSDNVRAMKESAADLFELIVLVQAVKKSTNHVRSLDTSLQRRKFPQMCEYCTTGTYLSFLGCVRMLEYFILLIMNSR